MKISPITFKPDFSCLNIQLDSRIHGLKHVPNMQKNLF